MKKEVLLLIEEHFINFICILFCLGVKRAALFLLLNRDLRLTRTLAFARFDLLLGATIRAVADELSC